MQAEYTPRGFDRVDALTQSLTPERAASVRANRAAMHELERALLAGFRPVARTKLSRLLRDVGAENPGDEADAALAELPRAWWFDPAELTVQVSGFGPFLDNARNPSWEVAQSFAEVLAASFETTCERVRVTYEEAAAFCERAAGDRGGRLVVHFGLRASKPDVAIERYAHNCRGQTRDESGRDDWPDVVEPGGPVALETLLPVRDLAARLDAKLRAVSSDDDELAVQMSRDVGEYVCNAIYYRSLLAVREARRAGQAAEALFVHVPRLDADRATDVGARFGKLFNVYLSSALTGTPFA